MRVVPWSGGLAKSDSLRNALCFRFGVLAAKRGGYRTVRASTIPGRWQPDTVGVGGDTFKCRNYCSLQDVQRARGMALLVVPLLALDGWRDSASLLLLSLCLRRKMADCGQKVHTRYIILQLTQWIVLSIETSVSFTFL